uniref:Carboxypeptidase A1 n=1 Tax=Callorhinchus milii TaxID=7868 RepID=A0A4W3IRU2_CALMI
AKDQEQASLIMSLEHLEHLQLDFWRRPMKFDLSMDIRVPRGSLQAFKAFLESNSVHYSVMIQDLQVCALRLVTSASNATNKLMPMCITYPSTLTCNFQCVFYISQIYYWMDEMVADYPNLVTKQQIGSSTEYQPLYVLKFSTGGASRPAIWIDSGIHAREWVSPASAIWMAKKMASEYGSDFAITSLLNKMDVFMEIVVNPDGYLYTHSRNRMWRKTRSKVSGSSCVGVDANRNFDAGFGGPGTSGNPCLETYRGTHAHSEPEVQAIVNFVLEHRNIKSFITIHSYSQLLMFPYGYKCSPPTSYYELAAIASSAVADLSSLYGTRYRTGTICDTIYQASGGSIDWTYDMGIQYSFAFELRDTGYHGFLLPPEQIIPTAQETWLAMTYIMDYVQARS